MSSSGVEIRLVGPETLGRRFQYAFLSMADTVEVYPARGVAVFPTVDDYVETVEKALQAVVRGLDWGPSSQGRQGCQGPSFSVGGLVIDCCRIDRGPSVYAMGKRIDVEVFRRAGLDKCYYSLTGGRRRGGGPTIGWAHAAISYALKVLGKGGPLGSKPEYDVPWLAKASLFGKTRSMAGAREAKAIQVDVDSLGTILLGGSLAYLGSHRVTGAGGGETVEFYVIPDYVSDTYRVLREVSVYQGIRDNLASRLARLVSELQVGVEQALALSYGSLLVEQSQLVTGIGAGRLLAAGKLYIVESGRRPQVRDGVPLTDILNRFYGDRLVKHAWWFAREALSARGDVGSYARRAASTCINMLFLQTMTSSELFLRDCARLLAGLLSLEPPPPPGLVGAATALLSELERVSRQVLSAMSTGSTISAP